MCFVVVGDLERVSTREFRLGPHDDTEARGQRTNRGSVSSPERLRVVATTHQLFMRCIMMPYYISCKHFTIR